MSNKGFTLVEMMLVLSLIILLTALFPMLHMPDGVILSYQMNILQQQLVDTQHTSMTQKRSVSVDFHGNEYRIDGYTHTLPQRMQCSGTDIHFNEMGNVSNAVTIHCHIDAHEKSLVIELGSGRSYVR